MSTSNYEHMIAPDNTPVHHVTSIASPRFLTVKEVASRLSISVSSVWRHAKEDETFPRPIHIARRSTRWVLSEIEAYEASRRRMN